MNAELEELMTWLETLRVACMSLGISAVSKGDTAKSLQLGTMTGTIMTVQDKISQIEADNAAVDSIVRWLEE